MTKDPSQPSGLQFPVQQNATTVGPNYTITMTTAPRLPAITGAVVLSEDASGLRARVFRKSSTAPGLYSSDLYERADNVWKYVCEERGKYEEPQIPPGARSESIGGFEFYTLGEMPREAKETLSKLLTPAT